VPFVQLLPARHIAALHGSQGLAFFIWCWLNHAELLFEAPISSKRTGSSML
jgi:hypothetical protein